MVARYILDLKLIIQDILNVSHSFMLVYYTTAKLLHIQYSLFKPTPLGIFKVGGLSSLAV